MKTAFGFISLLAFYFRIAHCKYFADEVNSMFYDLSISSFPLNAEAQVEESSKTAAPDSPIDGTLSTGSDFISLGNIHGQQYHCRFPTFAERAPGSDEGLLDPPPSSKVTNEEIQATLDKLSKGPCFKLTNGWWTYEFCYKTAIVQYHLDGDNKPSGETIYLGRFESEKDWTKRESIAELSGKRKKTLYHTHSYTNGTLCELTNKFRRAEVRFICDENLVLTNEAHLQMVDEPESCEYVLIVRTGALCRLPVFLPIDRKPTPLKIECQPALSAADFDGYIKAKQVEEAKKEEAAKKFKEEQEQLKLKMEAEKAKRLESQSQTLPPKEKKAESDLFDTFFGKSGFQKVPKPKSPVLAILGKSKVDYLKMTAPKEETEIKDEQIGEKKSKEEIGGSNQGNILVTNLGAEGTIEYEYMTHWLETETQSLETDDGDEVDEQLGTLPDLSEIEKYAVSELKKRTRRMSLSYSFQNQLDELITDLFDTIMVWDRRLEKLGAIEKALARIEIKQALTKALTRLLDQLDDVEREMETMGEKTNLSGVAAFQRMREEKEERERLVQEWQGSGLSAADFVKQKISRMTSVVDESMRSEDSDLISRASEDKSTGDSKPKIDSVGEEAGVGEAKKAANQETNAQSERLQKKRKQMTEWLNKEVAKNEREKQSVASNGKELDRSTDGQTKSITKKTKKFRQEMETQLDNIMGDVERELKDEGVFDDLNDQEVADVKTEAFRSLAKTLTGLLEKLDEIEKDVDTANQQLDEDSSWDKNLFSPSKRDKEAEKKLNIWRKLVDRLDDDEEEEQQQAKGKKEERKPLGNIQVKHGDADSKKNDGVRVRVSTIKRKENDLSKVEETESSETTKLERRIAEKLEEAGFDTQGRPVQVKIITNLNLDENADNFAQALSDEESEQFTNVIFSILGAAGLEQTVEQRRLESLEDSYNFGSQSDTKETKKKPASMKTVVGGGP